MHADGFKSILDEFAPAFDCTKPLCRKLRSILFCLTQDGNLDLGTPADPNALYEPTIKAFGDAIAGLETDT